MNFSNVIFGGLYFILQTTFTSNIVGFEFGFRYATLQHNFSDCKLCSYLRISFEVIFSENVWRLSGLFEINLNDKISG